QLIIPHTGLRIEHLGRCGIRIFSNRSARQQEMNEVGNQEKSSGIFRDSLVHVGAQLKQRIEDKKLNPGSAEYFVARDLLENLVHRLLRAFVAITDGVLTKL